MSIQAGRTIKIIVVDDEPISADDMSDVIRDEFGKSMNVDVRTAYNAKSVIKMVEESPCDILLSDTLEVPTLDNLWNYLSHFYDKVTPALKEQFSFEDLAGIYTENGMTRLFAVCMDYVNIDGIKVLPKGKYLCANCTEENREQTLRKLIHIAQTEYGVEPRFTVQLIVVSGILQWNYEAQVYVDR